MDSAVPLGEQTMTVTFQIFGVPVRKTYGAPTQASDRELALFLDNAFEQYEQAVIYRMPGNLRGWLAEMAEKTEIKDIVWIDDEASFVPGRVY